jgi:hypothetical protein
VLDRSRSSMPRSTSELINAVSHPLRRRILFAYLDGSFECASASEIAGATDQQVGQAAYHLKMLERSKLLRFVPGGAGGGAPGYRWALDVDAAWLRLVLKVWADSDVPG